MSARTITSLEFWGEGQEACSKEWIAVRQLFFTVRAAQTQLTTIDGIPTEKGEVMVLL